MMTVPQIESHLIPGVEKLTAAHLHPSGHAGPHPNPIRPVLMQIAGKERPWPDDRHLPEKNVYQLWQLVEPGASDKSANRGHSKIIRYRYAVVVGMPHGPELIESCCHGSESGPDLPENDRIPYVQEHDRGKERPNREKENEQSERNCDVCEPLAGPGTEFRSILKLNRLLCGNGLQCRLAKELVKMDNLDAV